MFRGAARASGQGELLRKLSPDLMLLQEVNLSAAEALRQAAGADWLVCAADLRTRAADDRPVRSRGVAIGGRGPAPRRTWLPADRAGLAPEPTEMTPGEAGDQPGGTPLSFGPCTTITG
jgi:hypothetical protein